MLLCPTQPLTADQLQAMTRIQDVVKISRKTALKKCVTVIYAHHSVIITRYCFNKL